MTPGTEPVEAIVVGAVDVGEADRIIRLLTPTHGRLDVMARGVRNPANKLRGTLDVGHRVALTLGRGRGGLPLAREVDLLSHPSRARQSYDRLILVAYGCEICASLAPEHHEAAKLFGLLVAWLDLLESPTASPAAADAARQALEAKALTFAGLTPALVRCARCGGVLDDPCAFDPEQGGALHVRCGGGAPFHADWGAGLERLRRSPLVEAHAIGPSGPRFLVSDFAVWHLGHALRSRALLEAP